MSTEEKNKITICETNRFIAMIVLFYLPVFSLSAAVRENLPNGFLPKPTMYLVKGSPIGVGEGSWLGSVAAEHPVSKSTAFSLVRVASVSGSHSVFKGIISSVSSPAPSLPPISSVVIVRVLAVVGSVPSDSSLIKLTLNRSLFDALCDTLRGFMKSEDGGRYRIKDTG